MICTYCETEYGMSHMPWQCMKNLIKQRDDAREQNKNLQHDYDEAKESYNEAREQVAVLRGALRKLVIHHASAGCTSAFHADTCGEAYEVLAATAMAKEMAAHDRS